MSDINIVQSAPLFIFLEPQDPILDVQVYVSIAIADPVPMVLDPVDPTLDPQQYKTVTLGSTIDIPFDLDSPLIELWSGRLVPDLSRRIHRSSWQARLGMKTDIVKRKIVDNSILLSSHPTDMLRVRVEKDPRSGDILNRTIIANEILPILFPALVDIPIRRLERDDGNWVLSGLDSSNEDIRSIEAYAPMEAELRRDDLLIRIIISDPDQTLPGVMVFQVKDELATFSYNTILYSKYNLSFYDETLPTSVLQAMVDAAAKREIVRW